MDDFNARSTLWYDKEINTRGCVVEKALFDEAVCILNNAGPTHIDPRTRTETCIDLSICSNSITLDFTWSVLSFLYNSDHFPIIVNFNNSVIEELPQRWHFQNANWKQFSNLAVLEDVPEFFNNIDDMLQFFITLVSPIATLCIKRTSGKTKRNIPW